MVLSVSSEFGPPMVPGRDGGREVEKVESRSSPREARCDFEKC